MNTTMRKRVLLAMLAACIAIPLFGCSNGDNKSLAADRKSEDPATQQSRKAKQGD